MVLLHSQLACTNFTALFGESRSAWVRLLESVALYWPCAYGFGYVHEHGSAVYVARLYSKVIEVFCWNKVRLFLFARVSAAVLAIRPRFRWDSLKTMVLPAMWSTVIQVKNTVLGRNIMVRMRSPFAPVKSPHGINSVMCSTLAIKSPQFSCEKHGQNVCTLAGVSRAILTLRPRYRYDLTALWYWFV